MPLTRIYPPLNWKSCTSHCTCMHDEMIIRILFISIETGVYVPQCHFALRLKHFSISTSISITVILNVPYRLFNPQAATI